MGHRLKIDKATLWKFVSAVELVIAVTVIKLDLFIPTLVILAICAISLLARGNGVRALGFKMHHDSTMLQSDFGPLSVPSID